MEMIIKNILKDDIKIQGFVVGLFLISIILLMITDYEPLIYLFIASFLLIAFSQFSLNVMKFFRSGYDRTLLRRVYMSISGLMVLSFFITFLCSVFRTEFVGYLILPWVILSPVLIVISLQISYLDFLKNNFSNSSLNNNKPDRSI